MTPKEIIRANMKEQRLALPREQVIEASREVCKKIAGLGGYARAKRVMVYMALNNEINLEPLYSAKGKEFYAPRMVSPGIMEAKRLGSGLIQNGWGILEPPASAGVCPPDKLDFIIVPLLAYDNRNYRLGYGGGYYDRFLALAVNAYAVGAAYSFQRVDELPVSCWDVPLDWVASF